MPEAQKRKDSFSDRLKELIDERKESGQTLRGLAKDLEVSLGVLSDWQNGNKTPRGDSIIKLARYFEVSADYLLGLTNARTLDADLRTAAEYAGLSEKAIIELKYSTPKHILDTMSEMIEQGIFLQLAWKVYDFSAAAQSVVVWESRIKNDLKLAKEASDAEYYEQVYSELCESDIFVDRLYEWFAENGELPAYLSFEKVMQDERVFKKYQKYVDSLTADQIAENSDMVTSIVKDLDLLEYQATRFLTLPMDGIARSYGVSDEKRLKARSVHDSSDEVRSAVLHLATPPAGDAPEEADQKKE